MNSYELHYILEAEMEDEARAALIQRYADLITSNGGEIESAEEWGKRKFAYPINYKNEGYYVLVNFKAPADFIEELGRNFRINENTVRYMIIKRD